MSLSIVIPMLHCGSLLLALSLSCYLSLSFFFLLLQGASHWQADLQLISRGGFHSSLISSA